MATTTNVTTTYAGEFALPYIQAALLNPSTIRNGGVTVKPNVKFKQVLKKVAMSDLIKDGSCDFTPTGTISLTENILQPIAMGLSAHDNLPPNLADFIIAKLLLKLLLLTKLSSGKVLLVLLVSMMDSQLVLLLMLLLSMVTGTTVNAGNVIAELGKVVDAIPALSTEKKTYSSMSHKMYIVLTFVH
jgi:hypothetical protein